MGVFVEVVGYFCGHQVLHDCVVYFLGDLLLFDGLRVQLR